jgi:thiol-disulfide isomerase/thioredoxin
MSQPADAASDDSIEPVPPGGNSNLILLAIPLTVVLVLFGMGIFGEKGKPGAGSAFSSAGEPLPTIVAEGWLNGEPPTAQEMAGHVVVLDVWATWCKFCPQSARELVKLHHEYKDRGVLFVGLSTESAEARSAMRAFLDKYKVTWPNGYGADRTLGELGVEGIPAVWVVGTDGKIVWDSMLGGTVEEAIQKALAATPGKQGT